MAVLDHTWWVTSASRTEARSLCPPGGEKQSGQEGEECRGRMQPLVQPAQLIPKSFSSAPEAFGHLLPAVAATVQSCSSGNVSRGGAAAPAQAGLRCGCETQPGCLRGVAVLAGQLLWRREEELPSSAFRAWLSRMAWSGLCQMLFKPPLRLREVSADFFC